MNRACVDSLSAPVLAELKTLTNRLVDEMDVSEKTRINQVKLEEQLKIEVSKNATLEAQQHALEEKLDTKEAVIKVLTEGADRIANNKEKDDQIKKLKLENAKLTRQLQQIKKDTPKRKRKKAESRLISLLETT